jgi:hypothetical protein
MEIMALHMKIDELREREWVGLVEIQQQQLALLERIDGRLTRIAT